MTRDLENKFNSLIKKSAADMATTMSDITKNHDSIAAEMIGNFAELFKWCVERCAATIAMKNASTVPKSPSITSKQVVSPGKPTQPTVKPSTSTLKPGSVASKRGGTTGRQGSKKAKLSEVDSNGDTPAPTAVEPNNTNTDQTDSDALKINPTIGELADMVDFDDDDDNECDHAEKNIGQYES